MSNFRNKAITGAVLLTYGLSAPLAIMAESNVEDLAAESAVESVEDSVLEAPKLLSKAYDLSDFFDSEEEKQAFADQFNSDLIQETEGEEERVAVETDNYGIEEITDAERSIIFGYDDLEIGKTYVVTTEWIAVPKDVDIEEGSEEDTDIVGTVVHKEETRFDVGGSARGQVMVTPEDFDYEVKDNERLFISHSLEKLVIGTAEEDALNDLIKDLEDQIIKDEQAKKEEDNTKPEDKEEEEEKDLDDLEGDLKDEIENDFDDIEEAPEADIPLTPLEPSSPIEKEEEDDKVDKDEESEINLRDQFEKLDIGMTYEEVTEVMSKEGKQDKYFSEVLATLSTFSWENDDEKVYAGFYEGELVARAYVSSDLSESDISNDLVIVEPEDVLPGDTPTDDDTSENNKDDKPVTDSSSDKKDDVETEEKQNDDDAEDTNEDSIPKDEKVSNDDEADPVEEEEEDNEDNLPESQVVNDDGVPAEDEEYADEDYADEEYSEDEDGEIAPEDEESEDSEDPSSEDYKQTGVSAVTGGFFAGLSALGYGIYRKKRK